MNRLRELVETLRKRATNLKKVANNCSPEEDRLALLGRADEVEHCVAAIEATLTNDEKEIQ